MADKKIGFAVIGYGGMGSFHVRETKKNNPGINLIGIYDIKEERCEAARENGIFAFESREALLCDDRIDLVTIATPNDTHKEIAIDAMAHGKNVICEKPVAMNSEELEEMIAASKKYGKLFTVHQNRRWDNDYLTVKNLSDKNTLGKIHCIESRVQGSRGIPGDWRGMKEHGGGMVLDWGVHLLDQILVMQSEKKLLSVYATLTHITNYECDDGFKAILKYEDDLICEVEVSTNNFISLPLWYVLGENGSATITDWDVNGEIVMVHDWENIDAVPVLAGAGLTKTMAPRTDDSIKKMPIEKVEGKWSEYYDNIVDTLNGKATQIVTHDQLRLSTKVMEAIFTSAKENAVVYF